MILFPLDPEFVHGLRFRFERVKRADKNIEDVYEGSLHRSKCGPGGFLSKEYNLSLKLNTDGVAIFHSSQFGVWPLFSLVNKLPPLLRYVNKMILCVVQSQCIFLKKESYLYMMLNMTYNAIFFLLTGGTAGSEYLVACGLVKKSLFNIPQAIC